MSNIFRLKQFLYWLNTLPKGIHLGREILSQAPKLKFLRFMINKSNLDFYVKVFVRDSKPIVGSIKYIDLDPENNLFSVGINNSTSNQLIMYNIRLSDLESFEQLSTSELMDMIKFTMKMTSEINKAKKIKTPDRGTECKRLQCIGSVAF